MAAYLGCSCKNHVAAAFEQWRYIMLRTFVWPSLLFIIALGVFASPESGAAAVEDDEPVYRRYSEIAPMLGYRIKYVDIPLVAEEMGLDRGQKDILEQMVSDYVVQLDVERMALLARLASMQEPSYRDDPAWEQNRKLRAKVKRVKNRGQRNGAIRQSMRGELDASADVAPKTSARTAQLRAWKSMHDEQWEILIGSVDLIRDPDEPSRWEAVARALRRRNTTWNPELYGEGVDLSQILFSTWGRSSDVVQKLGPILMQYAIDYDEALLLRDDVLERTTPVVLDAKVYGHPGPWVRSVARQVDARKRLVDINEAYVDIIAAEMDPDQAAEFRLLAYKALFPGVFMTHRFEHLVDYLRTNAADLGLAAEQLAAIDSLVSEYEAGLVDIRSSRIDLIRRAEFRRLNSAAEEGALMRCYDFMAPLDPESDLVFRERNVLRKKYFDYDTSFHDRLKSLIGPQQYDALPAYAYRPGLGDSVRSPVKDFDPNAPVVYLKGPGDREVPEPYSPGSKP